jgi:ABC-2 type transport system permease protein
LLSTPIGRYAPTTAALLVVVGADLLIAAGVTSGLIAYGLPVAGSLGLGAWFGAKISPTAAVAAVSADAAVRRRALVAAVPLLTVTIALIALAYRLLARRAHGRGPAARATPVTKA